MIETKCPDCGKIWTEKMDLLDLLNHPEVHRWLDDGCKGKTTWAIRQSSLTLEQKKAAIKNWACAEALMICQAMQLRIPAKLMEWQH